MRTSSIFRSRWMALLWAGGIIWTAVDFAGSTPRTNANRAEAQSDASGATVDSEQMNQAAQLLQQLGK